MKFHIVGNNESVKEILDSYDLSLDELKKENKHIRLWNYLIPGTKLKIPVLSESINQDINDMEPFIEDYYPKLKVEEDIVEIDNNQENINSLDEITESNLVEENNLIENTIVEKIDEQELDSKIQKVVEPINKRDKVIVGYIYPQPYYYRPVIYVIPRKK